MSNFARNHKKTLVAFVLLLLTTIVSAAYLRKTPDEPTGTVIPSERATSERRGISVQPTNRQGSFAPTISSGLRMTTSEIAAIATSTNDENQNNNQITEQPTSPTTTYPAFATATLQVGDATYTLQFRDGEYLIDAMRRLSTRSDKPFLFSGREYAGLGFFVEEINGVKNNPQIGEYWIYYVNGQSAAVGISNYILKINDLITWKYEKAKF